MNRGVPPIKVTDKNICEHLSGTNFVSPDWRRPNGAVPLHQHNFTIFLNWAFTTHSHLKRGTNFITVPQNLLIPSLHPMQPYHLPNIVPRVLSCLSTRGREPYKQGLHRNVYFPYVKYISFSSLSFRWISYPQRANHGI